MKKPRNWIIIDTNRCKSLHGVGNKTMMFSEKEIAQEIAEQIFKKDDNFIIVNIIDDLGLSNKL